MIPRQSKRRRAAKNGLIRTAAWGSLLTLGPLLAPVPSSASAGELGGFFHIHCPVSHSSHDDPIVYPGKPAATHLHDFFGNKSTNDTSTPASLKGGPTTCANPGDSAGYWTPSPVINGVRVRPPYQNEYWFDGGFKQTEAIPFGLEIVAGHAHATGAQPTNQVFYYCGQSPTQTPHLARPYDCRTYNDRGVIMVVVFPQCWDGRRSSTGNDTAHLAYPLAPGTCPAGFPHVLPRLEEHVHTGIISPYDATGKFVFALSSGPYDTLHGDFMNAWSPATLGEYVDDCINAHVTCGSTTPP